MKDLVTVFTPVYNRKNLIGNLYQSLLSQTYKNFEWIIVDDGSTDDIDEIIKSYQNEDRILIRFIKQENGGKHRAINNGVLHAKGELFYIVDSDEAPGVVAARDPESGETFVIFDNGRHGYNNLFCDEHDPAELEHRPLKRYEIPASKLVLELGCGNDYENEKEDFEVDEADTVELINGERMP